MVEQDDTAKLNPNLILEHLQSALNKVTDAELKLGDTAEWSNTQQRAAMLYLQDIRYKSNNIREYLIGI